MMPESELTGNHVFNLAISDGVTILRTKILLLL